MDISLIQGQAKSPEYIPLEEDWTRSVFDNMVEARDFAMSHGWVAKPQIVQMRKTEEGYIVERFDPTGCGCGG